MSQASSMEKIQLRVQEVLARDAGLRASMPDPAIAEAFSRRPDLPLEQSIDAILEGYATRPALGMRDYEIAEDPATGRHFRRYLPSFSTISYGEFRDRVRGVANAWRHDQTVPVGRDDLVCMIGFASADYMSLVTACFYAQAVPVPLQSVTSGADLDAIFDRVKPAAFAATTSDIVAAAQLAVKHEIPAVIVFDHDERDDEDRDLFERAQKIISDSNGNDGSGREITLTTIDRLVEIGEAIEWTFMPPHPEGDDRTGLLLHSSGSTGVPKGAMLSQGAVRESWNPAAEKLPEVGIAFAPLNHGMGLIGAFTTLRKGGSLYFTVKPDMSTLFEDIRLVRPTTMAFFPRVLDLVYQHYLSEVARGVRAGGSQQQEERRVKDEMGAHFLGDRLFMALVGSAPTSPAVKQFFTDCFDVVLFEGYASTEAGAGSIPRNDRIQRPNVIEYRLRDVPELGYYTTDRPYPRGELTYKSQHMVKGYYGDPEASAQLYDEDGFLLTGDIVEERGPDHVVLIDRRKDVQKLSQGEYVAVGPLGTLFEGASPVIQQVYVYGNSARPYTVAVVVPDQEEVARRLGETYDEDRLRNLIRDELQRVARQEELKSFEVPRDFIIEPEPFSRENGLLSSVHKRLRPALKKKYAERLEALYEAHDEKQKQDLEALRDPASSLTTLEKLAKVLEASLGTEGLDVSTPRTFDELGGDSLGATAFSLSVEEIFGVQLPADSILSPTGSLEKWANEIDRSLTDAEASPTFASIHGKQATEVHTRDLQLARFLGETAMERAASIQPVSNDVRTVLLTGANGFLGRHVCLQWMERLAENGGKLICLVRGADDEGARERLDAVFTGPDPEFEARYRELAEKHLEVLAGDAGEPHLGLDEETFDRLAREADRICHVAALVNHRLAYEHLFGPNVVGTAEIIRLAVTERKKPIDFVSTEGVLPLLDASGGSNEAALPLPTVPLVDQYAAGYATSKWAGECLLRQAAEELAVPVNILRGNMMLADQRYGGQINTGDMFTRLLHSVVVTGLAPYSFYELGDDGKRSKAHYDGLPVDVVAASVVAVAGSSHDGCRAFNIHNYHDDDGCSLDAFVDWIESTGYPVTRIQDHAEWFSRFQDKLNVLPPDQKKQSAADVLGAFARPHAAVGAAHIDCENFRELVKNWKRGTEIPHLDERFLHKCLADMARLGLIPEISRA